MQKQEIHVNITVLFRKKKTNNKAMHPLKIKNCEWIINAK